MEWQHLVEFFVEDHRYAIRLEAIERVIPSVESTLLPDAPEIIIGVIDWQGIIVPIVDFRKICGLPAKNEPDLNDHFIIVKTKTHPMALHVDQVQDVTQISRQQVTAVNKIVSEKSCVDGVVKLGDGLVLIYDVDLFLTRREQTQLSKALGIKKTKRRTKKK